MSAIAAGGQLLGLGDVARRRALYSRKRSISGSISASALACFRYSAGSLCTSLVPSSRISSS